ncbi:MAG: radical SAM protein, partial [Bacteroidaceae bacterium]|nr:radical SAM protein [Bacteroidaceae bacterium]
MNYFSYLCSVNALKGKKAVYLTLGCKLNFAETSTIQQQMEAAGVETARNGEVADICIVNTCSVTEVADSKSRQAISKLHRKHPEAHIVVTGCYAQLHPEKLAALEGVDIVVGKEGLLNNVISLFHNNVITETETPKAQPFVPACARGERTRFFLKVQDGCDYYCTYCTIPFARGRSRNGSVESLVAQAEQAAREGGKEVVLTGVNIGDYGRTTGESFLELLQALDRVEGIQRYRISSIEPNLL